MLNLDWNVIFQIINIIVFFLLLKKFLFKPVTDIMEKRENLIRSQMEEAEDSRKKANELKAEYQAQLEGAKEEAAAILKEAKARGEKEYELQLANAGRDAQKLIRDAQESARLEREKAVQGARGEIAALAIAAASKVAEKNIKAEDNKRFIDDFLSEAGEVQ